ncbi:MAG: HAMP domain-containing protein [Clostridiales bacterium]|jgi:signal transduction histidine kinase|nr:HAMP domain-containing protein [Clostridiales bacterium]
MPFLEEARRKLEKRGKMSIGTKIGFMYAGVFTFALMGVSVAIVAIIMNAYKKFSLDDLVRTAEKVAAHIENGGALTEEALEELNPDNTTEIVVTLTGWDHWPVDAIMPDFPSFVGDELKGRSLRPGQVVRIRDINYMFGQKIAHVQGRAYLIMVFRNYQREMEMINLCSSIFLALNIFGLGVSAVVGRGMSHVTLRPIRRIIQTAERIGIEDLSQRIQIDGPRDEITELSISFNDMIARLETSFLQQNQFVSDASHELRTPITVIQGYASLIDRWGKNNPEVLQESIDSIKLETEHMALLVKRLLFMAKTDQKRMVLQKKELDLAAVAEEMAKEMNVMQLEASVKVESSGKSVIYGDYDLIKQLMRIFLENAIKYSKKPEDPILLKTKGERERCILTVKDYGIGIKEEDLPHIFERFYRADKARSNGVPGTGLGLSIASWIIRQHGAGVEVKSTFGKGTEIIVTFKRLIEDESKRKSDLKKIAEDESKRKGDLKKIAEDESKRKGDGKA